MKYKMATLTSGIKERYMVIFILVIKVFDQIREIEKSFHGKEFL